MKNIFYSVLLIFSFNTIAQKNINLKILHKLNNVDFELDKEAVNNANQVFKLSKLLYYIGDISLVDQDDNEIVIDTNFLINLPQETNFNLGQYDVQTIKSIRFGVGVKESKNHLDPTSYSMDHPLAPKNPTMHWGWASGYRFVVLEGKVTENFAQSTEIHALGDTNYYLQTHMNPGMHNGNTIDIIFNANYEQALKNIDLSSGTVHHGDLFENCIKIMKNFRDHVFVPNLTLSTKKYEKSSLSIYPNPAKDKIYFSEEIESLKIRDLTGKLIYRIDDLTQSTDISFLHSGIYLLEYNKDGKIFNQKLKVD